MSDDQAAPEARAPENKRLLGLQQELGTLEISRRVFEHIARTEVMDVAGVAHVSGGFLDDIMDAVKSVHQTGVDVSIGPGEVAIDLDINVYYGQAIPLVAQEVRGRVIQAVEKLTGYNVRSLRVSVDGLVDPKRAKKKAEPPEEPTEPDEPDDADTPAS